MNLRQLQWRLLVSGLLLLAAYFLIELGELWGWWNEYGQVLAPLAAYGGVLLTILGVVMASSRGQVEAVATGVSQANGKLDQGNRKLDRIDNKLDRANTKLDDIHTEVREGNRRLDRIADILGDIRDRLRA